MNLFQKQILIAGKSLAELRDLENKRRNYGKIVPPSKVSVEEFEKDMKKPITGHRHG